MIADTPEPPYYAVIFTSRRTGADPEEYGRMAGRMVALAEQQAGFLGVESAREDLGITVSYWASLAAIQAWKRDIDHVEAQRKGRAGWYSTFTTRIARVERDYRFALAEAPPAGSQREGADDAGARPG